MKTPILGKRVYLSSLPRANGYSNATPLGLKDLKQLQVGFPGYKAHSINETCSNMFVEMLLLSMKISLLQRRVVAVTFNIKKKDNHREYYNHLKQNIKELLMISNEVKQIFLLAIVLFDKKSSVIQLHYWTVRIRSCTCISWPPEGE